jgi:hypothetical protein
MDFTAGRVSTASPIQLTPRMRILCELFANVY